MSDVSHRFAWYLAVLQPCFTLCGTVYAVWAAR